MHDLLHSLAIYNMLTHPSHAPCNIYGFIILILFFRRINELKMVKRTSAQKVGIYSVPSRPGIPGQSRFLSRVPG